MTTSGWGCRPSTPIESARSDGPTNTPGGTSLDGAELLARRAPTGELEAAEPLLTVH